MNCYLFMRLRLQASVFSVACMFETVLLLIPQRSYARLFLSKNYAFSCTPRNLLLHRAHNSQQLHLDF